jgi:proline racemase
VLPSTITTTDHHTAGEPFRIVVVSPVPIVGSSVAERRAFAIKDPAAQELRAVLCSEPRGHAVLETVTVDGRPAVIPQVTGTAYRTGEHVFCVDPNDPLLLGFVLR